MTEPLSGSASAAVGSIELPADCCPDPSTLWEQHQKPSGHVEGVLNIYHRAPGGSPVQLHAPAFSRRCSADPPRRFPLTVRDGWTEIECAGADLVIVANMEGRGLQRVPTAEQAEEIAARVVELGVDRGGMDAEPLACDLVRPACVRFFEPPAGARFFVRCRRGEARLVVTAVGGSHG